MTVLDRPKVPVIAECAKCGQPFAQTKSTRRFCSARCREAARKARLRGRLKTRPVGWPFDDDPEAERAELLAAITLAIALDARRKRAGRRRVKRVARTS